MLVEIPKTRVEELKTPFLESQNIRIFIKREDLNDPLLSGNKFRKLKYNLMAAREIGADTLLTYGGAYSNQVFATAAAGKRYGFKTIGLIRGDELNVNSNPTLKAAADFGMTFVFLPRKEFSDFKSHLTFPAHIDGKIYVLPEGGTNKAAIQGCAEITEEITIPFDILCTPIGTGGTMVGLLKGLAGQQEVWGFSALRGSWINENIKALLTQEKIKVTNFKTFSENNFGGYGKFDFELINFMKWFYNEKKIALDPIYTAKMCFRLWEMLKNEQIAKGSIIVLLHTGGLQGVKGFNQKYNTALPYD
ncbi:MAG: 1-aminocyclopropane-1-carboxylate deaminase [Flammeovirgaceae bacterium]|nr:1-aminocyclopropane-1-carboxylate deaminase [Flammeovirgaceae bacterium]